MKLSLQAAALAWLSAGGSSVALSLEGRRAVREGDTVSPVTQVISLLGDLESKINKAASKEDAAHKKFSDWCRGGTKDKEYEIKTAKSNIDELTATIGKANSDLSTSSAKIQDLAGTISTNEADLKAAAQVREKEKSEFLAAEAELMDVVDTLDRAINVLERKMRGSALVQAKFMAKVDAKDVNKLVQSINAIVDATALSIHDKQRLVALAQSHAGADEDEDDVGAPAAAAYKSHGDGIIDVLEDMREKAESQLAELRKQEVNGKHNYEMTRQSVEDQIHADQKDMDEARASSANAAEVKATAEGDLTVTKKDLTDAEESLDMMKSSCMTAASDHEASVKARTEELEVLAEAKKTLLESASGAAGQAYSFLQLGDGRQASSSAMATRSDLANFEVVNLVRRLAKRENSAALAQLANRIQAAMKFGSVGGADPFEKVKALISDMIMRLEEEAGHEATHKAYCDKEMGGTQEKIDDLTFNLDRFRSKVDKKAALSVTLKNEVQELQAELAALAKSQADLDGVRREESKAYAEKKADFELGLHGVRQALRVLREYYSKEGAAFLQQRARGTQDPEVPEYHSKAEGASSGIIGMLEVVESDFGKGLAQAEMEEDSAATDYEKISMKNRLTKATKDQDAKYKSKEFAELDKAVAELRSDGESAQSELDAVLEYSTSIRAQCVQKPETFEERKGRREAEISGLRSALSILEGEAVFLQQSHKALRGSL